MKIKYDRNVLELNCILAFGLANVVLTLHRCVLTSKLALEINSKCKNKNNNNKNMKI